MSDWNEMAAVREMLNTLTAGQERTRDKFEEAVKPLEERLRAVELKVSNQGVKLAAIVSIASLIGAAIVNYFFNALTKGH